ncbi:ATP-binding protein [Paraglaciecola aquimarina]|uniref:histidine kinase n=1 Tax=Paraglaciecola algarum TaxID=3050085 RepID=A0ABS9DDJ3_9ALTE|nr:ATP-binding protein [Paraglaciecola sp. G1-23]MCF2950430.1 ATP-binding protein [Paraglaciecola sp. G1-23]
MNLNNDEYAKRIAVLERKVAREKKARNLAENQLEKYSLEIYETNQSLQKSLAFSKRKQAELAYLGQASIEVASEQSLNELMAQTVSLTGKFADAACGFYLVTDRSEFVDKENVQVWQGDNSWRSDIDFVMQTSQVLPLNQKEPFESWLVSPVDDVTFECKNDYKWITYTNFSLLNNRVAWIVFFSSAEYIDEETLYVLETSRTHLLSGIRKRLTDVKILKRTVQLQDTVSSLEQAKRQLVQSEKMASLGQLAAGVAHEINNPIAFIHSNMQVLQDYLNDYKELDTQIRKYLATDQIFDQAAYDSLCESIEFSYIQEDSELLLNTNLEGLDRVKEIVENLKSFSHAGDQKFSEISLYECVEAALKIAWNSLKYDHQVENNLDVADSIVLGNLGQLQQVFVNLFINSAHAMEGGGQLSISQTLLPDSIIVHVTDCGSGMDQDTVNKLFTPFFTTKPVGVGTGLGLSISYAILEAHSATIEVDSILGKGTTFNITFPLI